MSFWWILFLFLFYLMFFISAGLCWHCVLCSTTSCIHDPLRDRTSVLFLVLPFNRVLKIFCSLVFWFCLVKMSVMWISGHVGDIKVIYGCWYISFPLLLFKVFLNWASFSVSTYRTLIWVTVALELLVLLFTYQNVPAATADLAVYPPNRILDHIM